MCRDFALVVSFPQGPRPSMISEKQRKCNGVQRVNGVSDQLGQADPALTLRVYAHAMGYEETDLSFADFSNRRRPCVIESHPSNQPELPCSAAGNSLFHL
jgi:hypothetical protein